MSPTTSAAGCLYNAVPVQQKNKPGMWANISPYIRLTRIHKFPAGSNVVFWPYAWGVIIGARLLGLSLEQVGTVLGVCLLGSTLRHNYACIWNDICDRDFDKQVERSKSRPLASGEVSMTGAVTLLVAHAAICYGLMSLAGPEGTKVGLVGMLILDPIYPLTKRVTHWPQAILGLDITWGLPTAWIALLGYNGMDALGALYIGGVCWAIYYDTIYACQDRRDDLKAGVKSTAVLFGDSVRPILAAFAAAFVLALFYVGQATQAGILYYAITVAGGALCFAWQLMTIDFDKGADCWGGFQANGNSIGFVLFGGMMADYLMTLKGAYAA